MEDKNILPRLSRKMLESSFLSFSFLLLVDDVLSLLLLGDDVLVVVVATVEKHSRGCDLAMVLGELAARSLGFVDGIMRRVVAEVATERDGSTTSEVFMRLQADCNNVV